MSFSAEVKDELARVWPEDKCCRRAELGGILYTAGVLRLRAGQSPILSIVTENAAVARKAFLLVKDLYGISAKVIIRRSEDLRKANVYSVSIPRAEKPARLLSGLTVSTRKKCCKRANLRGMFLGGGAITNPRKGYHLEIRFQNEQQAAMALQVLQSFGINGKSVINNAGIVVYCKYGDEIAKFLGLVGAHGALLQYENARVVRRVKNEVNRLVNMDTANLQKTVDASVAQIDDIKFIEETKGLQALPERLREIAQLRLEHPEASLKELGEMLDQPLGKSGVNHRLRRIRAVAENLRKQRGSVENRTGNTRNDQ